MSLHYDGQVHLSWNSLLYLLREPYSDDDPVILAILDVEIGRHPPIVIEGITQQVEHTLACWTVPVITQLEAKGLARLAVKPDDHFHIEMILRWTPARAYIMYT
jgi:hypothetical protein